MRPVAVVVVLLGFIAAGLAPAVALGELPQTDFSACEGGGRPPRFAVATHTENVGTLPADSIITVPTTQPWAGTYQQTDVQVGNQVFNMTLDTGSSWMVLNASAVADNAQIVPTGRTAAVTYGGGATCAAGPVVTAPVSIGGRKPQQVTFLLAESGDFPFLGILGINTWQPPASALDNPLPTLGIDAYQITLPRSADPKATGNWVLNAQPDIDRADQRRVAVFKNGALAGGNRVFVPGTMMTSASVEGEFMLDIGTPQNIITVFPQAARRLGYDFGARSWATPRKAVRVEVQPSGTPPFELRSSIGPTRTGDMFTLSSRQAARPYSGVTGLAGTSAIIGADYVRDWVMGVSFTARGSVVRLLARERSPAQTRRCGRNMFPVRIKADGLTRLVRSECRVNGSPVAVGVKGPVAHRLIKRSNGSLWLRAFGATGSLSVTWRAQPYLFNNRMLERRRYHV